MFNNVQVKFNDQFEIGSSYIQDILFLSLANERQMENGWVGV